MSTSSEDEARVLRERLERAGDALVLRLLRKNLAYVANTAEAASRSGIPQSALRLLRASGRVISWQPSKDGEHLYPMEQFGNGHAHRWVAEIICVVGNGAPALDFLYAHRRSLGGHSFAELLRDPSRDNVPDLIQAAISKLVADDPCSNRKGDEMLADPDTPRGRAAAIDEIRRTGGPTYGTDPAHPGMIVQRLPNGTKRLGRWIGGEFVVTAGLEAS